MRIYVEEAVGFAAGGYKVDGFSHYFRDVTDSPAPTIMLKRPVSIAISGERGPESRRPYKVPSMAEIHEKRGTSGLAAISTFSGCGGSCLGLEWAGFEILWASEFIESARETYKANHPGVPVDGGDIRDVNPAALLASLGLKRGEVDLLEGSPPCASFSTAGRTSKGWGEVVPYSETTQRVDDLFFEFARFVEEIQPRAFIAENVAGLVRGVAKGYFLEILARLKACGYRVEARLVDAQWLGVPQARRRTIFIGTREDLDIEPRFPKPFGYRYSIADALPCLGSYAYDTKGMYRRRSSLDEPIPTVTVSGGVATHHQGTDGTGAAIDEETRKMSSLEDTAIGREVKGLRPGGQSERYFSLVRPDKSKPCPTITQTGKTRGAASVVHPIEARKFTIAELRRLCGFPDDFVVTGSYSQQWERLGRAVPPPMMRAIGLAVRSTLEGGGNE